MLKNNNLNNHPSETILKETDRHTRRATDGHEYSIAAVDKPQL